MTSNPASDIPAPDGEWIEWRGGENPVPGQRVEWLQRYQDHPSLTWGPRESEDCRWTHSGWDTDIIAYRIAPHPDREAEPTGGVVERARKQIELGRQTGADGGGKSPSNIYVIAAELLQALSVSPPVVEGSSPRDTQPGSDGAVVKPAEIWVVGASSGEYSDRTEWNIAAYTDEQAAKDEVARLTIRARQLAAEEPGLDDSDYSDECPIYGAWKAWRDKVAEEIGGGDPQDTQFYAGPVPFRAARHQPTTPGEQGEEG